MEATRPTLPQRVSAVLRARQYIVFYAIALYCLDVAVPLLSAWLYRREALPVLLGRVREPLADAVAARSALLFAVVIAYLLATAWFRAGYIRSLVGPWRLAPASTRQFLRLLGLEAALVLAAAAAGLWSTGAPGVLAALAVFALYVVALYADYIIVLADSGPVTALARSWRVVRAAPLPSFAVLMTVTLLGMLTAMLPGDTAGDGLAGASPLLIVRCVLMGTVLFVADVVLVVLYLDDAGTDGDAYVR